VVVVEMVVVTMVPAGIEGGGGAAAVPN